MKTPELIDLLAETLDDIDRLCCKSGGTCGPCDLHPCPCRDCELVHCLGRGKGECPSILDDQGELIPEIDVGDTYDEGDEDGLRVG
jgi:hypothetical protein